MTQIIDSQLFVYWDNASVFTDFSREAESQDTSKTADFTLDADKFLYLGKANTFNHRYFNFKTPIAGGSLIVEYYSKDASDWVSVEELVDRTYDFSENGHIYFKLPEADWEKQTVNSKELYWFRISASAELASLSIHTIKNLFSDDAMVMEYLPELNRYLPSAQSNFLYLHELTKNEIVNDLKAGERIDYEDQVKDISLISLQQLSCYKFLEILLLPMIEDESIAKMYSQFKNFYASRLEEVRLSIDSNKDETIGSSERGKISFATISRV